MATVDLVMPKMGESIMEATILKWHKQAGDLVKMDETVLEIATDKVDSEVPSTAEGVLDEVLFQVNDVVPIGTVIAGSVQVRLLLRPRPRLRFSPKPAAAGSNTAI
jgi:2-oxoglutarate dehydrogenase E2 component (dihydrolipoamide succinyltransferase)